jgi:hypothetical protein
MLIILRSKGRPNFNVNKVRLGYFYCDVQFYFVTVEILECFALVACLSEMFTPVLSGQRRQIACLHLNVV